MMRCTQARINRIGHDQGVTPSAQESIWMFQRAASYTLCGGMYQSFFDLHGGYYSHPRMFEGVSAMREMQRRSADYDCSSVSEMVALFDEPSQAYQTFESDWGGGVAPRVHLTAAGLRFQTAFIKSGAPFDILYMADLENANMDQYKVFFFVNAWQMDAPMRQLIKEKLARPGKTLVWCYAPGYFNGNKASAAFMKKLTGIRIEPSADEALIAPQMELNDAGRQWLAKAGEAVPPKPMGMPEKVCKLFEAKDGQAEVLATLSGASAAAMARKTVNGATSYWVMNSVLAPEVVRAIGKGAGVHFYCQAGDTFGANRSYLYIHASSTGDRTVKLPGSMDVYDTMTERKLWRNVAEFEDSFMFGQTRTYRLATPDNGWTEKHPRMGGAAMPRDVPISFALVRRFGSFRAACAFRGQYSGLW